MWLIMNCLVLFAVIHFDSLNAAYIERKELSGPNWPTEYFLRGEIVDVFNAGAEPFEIWYSGKQERSRVDVYNSLVKKYYWADRKKLITIHPKSEDLETIETKCDFELWEKEAYNILPVGLNWTLTGNGTYNGVDTQIWENKEGKYHHSAVTRKDGEFDVPIRLERIKFKVGKGMTVEHYNTIFVDYKATVENNSLVIDTDQLRKCDSPYGPYGTIEEKVQHLRPYVSHDVEVAFDRHVSTHNNKNLGYKLELNQFADWTDEELASLRGALPSKVDDLGTHPFPLTLEEVGKLVEELPEEYDLRVEGGLPSIKNQLECGSCWAFATTAAVEAAIIKKLGGVQLDLSEQSLVDCAWSYGLYGCNGGFIDAAFRYVTEHGIPTEAEYGGYLHEDGSCHMNNMSLVHHISGYTKVTPHSVNALRYALYTYGPVEVSIYASEDMVLYSSGVFYDLSCEGERLNHAVVVVGYGSRDGEPYWIVRNSWGETWGEDGYILMSAKDNNCLVLDNPYYPVV